MERKIPTDWNAKRILSIVFSVLGGIYIILGAVMLLVPRDNSEVKTVGAVFLPLGFVLTVLGLVIFLIAFRQQKRQKKLIEEGRYIWGVVAQLQPNLAIKVNRQHPLIAVVQFRDNNRIVHTFRSRNLYRCADQSLVGKQVKVYTQAPKYTPYYVDIEPLLKTN